jgi:hypothetical protein
MKRTSKPKRIGARADDLKLEYSFDYSKAKPNRFAERALPGSVAVVLDPDIARVFKDAGSVNSVLRALMQTMPRRSSS